MFAITGDANTYANYELTRGVIRFYVLLLNKASLLGSMVLQSGDCDLLGMNKAVLCIFLGSVLVGEMSHMRPSWRKSRLAAAEYFSLLDEQNSLQQVRTWPRKGCKPFKGELELHNVRFAYPNRPKTAVLDGFSMRVRAGETVVLVGESGSGKSTVLGLVEGLYCGWRGEIWIDGRDVGEMDVSELRGQIGMVEQEPRLFDRSIRENITYGMKNAAKVSQKQVEEAAGMAQAHKFIMELENGYDTRAGIGGIRLSGGQRQRVAIARAVVRRPKILLMDEISSALDGETEGELFRTLEKVRLGRTCVFVAHRLAAVMGVGRSVVVEKGRVVEVGRGGAYATFGKLSGVASGAGCESANL